MQGVAYLNNNQLDREREREGDHLLLERKRGMILAWSSAESELYLATRDAKLSALVSGSDNCKLV
jgi:hypothetical protein